MTDDIVGTALPDELTTFVDRRQEIADLKRMVQRSRLVTVVGPGGVGKSRLAGRVARQLRRGFADGVWWCELAATPDEGQLIDLLASELQVAATTLDQLAECLQGWAALVVLDNCEHLADDCAELTATLLRRCPGLRFIATSRQRLGVPGEAALHLGPLKVPAIGADGSSAIDEAASVTLFMDRAQRLDPSLAGQHLGAIAEICRRLDGLPLAIELAAAWLPVLTPPAILQRLDEPLGLLTRGASLDGARHRTLAESIEWSYELCTPDERRLWRYLAAFVNGCALDAVEFVAGRIGLSPERALEVLEGLVRKSVLAHHDMDGADWFSMLVPLRDFGLSMLGSESERRDAYEILLDFYLAFFERAELDWHSPRQGALLVRFPHETPNVRQALEFALTDGERPEAVFGLTVRLFRPFWYAQGRAHEHRRWLARAIAVTDGVADLRPQGVLLYAYGLAAIGQDDGCRHALAAVRPGSEGSPLVAPYLDLVTAALLPDDAPEARRGYESFYDFAKDDPMVLARSGVRIRLAMVYDRQFPGSERSERFIDDLVAASRSSGERFELMFLLFGLGANALARGDADRALELSRESLRLGLGLRPTVQTAHTVETIAAASLRRGQLQYAASLLGVADGLWHLLDRTATWFPQLTLDADSVADALRTALGAEEMERHRAAGRGLGQGDGIRFALDPSAALPAGRRRREQDGQTGQGRQAGQLTARELEIAALVAEGMSDREIAAKLVISVRTAQGHVQRALVKLGLTSRTQLAIWVAGRNHT